MRLENNIFLIYYTVKSGECQFPSFQNYLGKRMGRAEALPCVLLAGDDYPIRLRGYGKFRIP